MSIHTATVNVGDRDLILETGRYAEQTGAAVTATYGDTVVFVSVMMGRANPGLGYFPLSVEYQEKLYAGGRIKGSRWVKREGRPTDEAILKARLIDRTIRPLFPKGLINEVQVIVTVLSADGENDADMPAMYAVSAALQMSNIPWEGPISAVRIGLHQETGELMVNPTFENRLVSDLDLVISGTQKATVMVEAGANEVNEEKMLEAFSLAESENTRISNAIIEFAQPVAKEKTAFEPKLVDETIKAQVKKTASDTVTAILAAKAASERGGTDKDIVDALVEKIEDATPEAIAESLDELVKELARERTLNQGIRPDGRKPTDIRPLFSDVGLLPRTHGSAMFKRGQTQALTITTLGSPAMNQLIENMEGEAAKRYIHHYFFPPFCVGETGRVGYPSRREIGHGALAERALEPMIPAEEDFPYTVRVVSEIMSSNGSSSMASVCGSTLSLMDAGVPLKKPVAGIAMGLVTDGKKYIVLSDIQGIEDHTGDMDFKVAGTKDGITALQMDIKVKGVPFDVLKQALNQAREGRLHIMEHMLSTLSAPRPSLSQYAPKIDTIKIPVERIGELIGPGGKIIKAIIADSGAQVDVEDDGSVFITAIDAEAMNKARTMIEGLMKEVLPGEEYDGTITRIENFGAFVEVAPGKQGLVHVSRMSPDYVRDANDVVKIGDVVHVRVTEIDSMGRINLTMLTPEQEATAKESGGGERRGGGGGFGGGSRGGSDRGPRRSGGDRGGDRGGDFGFRSRRPR
jgi:polyribonucleotide nucleotidyltransferase